MNIKTFKLNSGEEVIGKVVSEDDTYYVVEDVRIIYVQQVSGGDVGVALLPFMVSATNPQTGEENAIKFFKNNLIAVVDGELSKQLEDAYIQNVSKIELVS